jgi:metal-responsive CopG/Arc/MetJ family transcriptional regulator
MKSAKIAISLPLELARRVERLRKETGESRSAMFRKAVERIFEEQEQAKRRAAYIEGYRKYPDSPDEMTLPISMVSEIIAKDPWE